LNSHAETFVSLFVLLQNLKRITTITRTNIHDNMILVKHSKKKILKRKTEDTSQSLGISNDEDKTNSSSPTKKSKTSHGIDKTAIFKDYQDTCINNDITFEVTTTNKGETHPTTHSYPTRHQLVKNCTMKPSFNHYYRVDNLHFDNVIIFLIKEYEKYLSTDEIKILRSVNSLYRNMIDDIVKLRSLDFSNLRKPRLNYNEQTTISNDRVDMTTACFIHYGFHPGMMICFIKGEFVNEHLDVDSIINEVGPHISSTDANHIHRILTQGCPSHIDFEERFENKQFALQRGNQQTFLQHRDVTMKAINKVEKNSQVLPLKLWTVYFSPWCRATPQGLKEKDGKYRVIFDASTQSKAEEVMLNHVTPTDDEPEIDFGQAKAKLLTSIYNWRISYPDDVIFISLADVTACFRQQHISCDVTGAFGFVANDLYFLSTSHVFGSNTSASAWEPRRRAIEALIPIYAKQFDLVKKHQERMDQ